MDRMKITNDVRGAVTKTITKDDARKIKIIIPSNTVPYINLVLQHLFQQQDRNGITQYLSSFNPPKLRHHLLILSL